MFQPQHAPLRARATGLNNITAICCLTNFRSVSRVIAETGKLVIV